MSQDVENLATSVAALVREEMARAELRGREAGKAAGREELRQETAVLQRENDGLRERLGEAEARIDGGDERVIAELREENRLLREQLDSCRSALRNQPVPPKPDSKLKGDGKAAKK